MLNILSSQKKIFILNGQKYVVFQNTTLKNLVKYFNYNYDSNLFILEYNYFICIKKNWLKYTIKHNDKIEIVSIVGGG